MDEYINKMKCQTCQQDKEHTEEYWHHDSKTESGLNEKRCKDCANKYRKKMKHKVHDPFTDMPYVPDKFGHFEGECLKQQTKRIIQPLLSIYKPL
jgi:hypothetical protein